MRIIIALSSGLKSCLDPLHGVWIRDSYVDGRRGMLEINELSRHCVLDSNVKVLLLCVGLQADGVKDKLAAIDCGLVTRRLFKILSFTLEYKVKVLYYSIASPFNFFGFNCLRGLNQWVK